MPEPSVNRKRGRRAGRHTSRLPASSPGLIAQAASQAASTSTSSLLWASGDNSFDESAHETAIAAYERAYSIDPTVDGKRWIRWAQALRHLDRYKDARLKLQEGLRARPDDSDIMQALAHFEHTMGN